MNVKRIRWLLLAPAFAAAAVIGFSASVHGEKDIYLDDDIVTHLEDAIICDEGDRDTDSTIEAGDAGLSRFTTDSPTIDESI